MPPESPRLLPNPWEAQVPLPKVRGHLGGPWIEEVCLENDYCYCYQKYQNHQKNQTNGANQVGHQTKQQQQQKQQQQGRQAQAQRLIRCQVP